MAWIESHTVLLRHRKLVSFAIELGIKPVHAVGLLTVLWHAVLEQQEDGDLTGWSDTFISTSAQWEGDPVKFCTALRSNGWLDGAIIHDWLDYSGRFLHSKYHTSNPKKWLKIRRKHKAYLKSTFRRTLGPNNLPNLTIPNLPTTSLVETEGFYEKWNAKMPWKVKRTGSRDSSLGVRLKDKDFEKYFDILLDKILASDFLMGKKPSKGHANFKATFDWIIKNDTNYVKVLEGRYDNNGENI